MAPKYALEQAVTQKSKTRQVHNNGILLDRNFIIATSFIRINDGKKDEESNSTLKASR
jgi:hypothetical protein